MMARRLRRLRFLLHNVVAHPVAGICWFFGLGRLGDWLHDVTS